MIHQWIFFIKIIDNVITCADAILKIICSLTIRINVTKNYIGLCKNESTTKLSIDVTCILCKQNERIESSQFLFKQNSRIMLEKANMTCLGNLRFFSFLLTKVKLGIKSNQSLKFNNDSILDRSKIIM